MKAKVKTIKSAEGEPQVISVAIVEDDPVVREQLVHQFDDADGFECVCSEGSAEAGLKEIPQHKPDVVLMDIHLPKMDGIECLRRLKQQLPETQFVVITLYEDANIIFKALLAGAVGYLLKGRTGSGPNILEAVREAAQGGTPLNGIIARKIVQYFHRKQATASSMDSLTQREMEVLELLSKGLHYKEIASQLQLSTETVRKHCHHIYEKLQVTSRTEAVIQFLNR